MSTLLSRIFGRKKNEPAPPASDSLDVSALKPLMSPKEFAEVRQGRAGVDAPAAPVSSNPDDLSGDWRMDQVLKVFPAAQRALFQRYHIGGCSSCGYEPGDSLASVASSHGVATDEIVRFVKDSAATEADLEITPSETAGLLSKGAIRLVDVRTPQEYAIARIEGSQLIDQALIEEITHGWPKDTPIVTVCHHGVRSLDAVAYLRGHGLKNARSMRGGIDAWSVTVDPRVPRY
jgi:rhodanese-related sulfurtransferase